MDLTGAVGAAATRAKIKGEVRRLLASLPKASRIDILVELAQELDEALREVDPPEDVAPPASRLRGPRGKGKGQQGRTHTEVILGELAANPMATVRDLAKAAYGTDDRGTQGKVRSLISALKGRGKLLEDKGRLLISNAKSSK